MRPNPFRLLKEGCPVFDKREFHETFHHAYKAAMFGGNPYPDPKAHGVTLNSHDGPKKYTFADCTENRVGLAVTRRYKGQPEKGFNFLMRFFALDDVWEDARVKKWMRQTDDGKIEFNDVLLDAAAVTTLKDGDFDLDEFFCNAEQFSQAGEGESGRHPTAN
jgi:hypothetical protein